jgi:hypothetical protein
MTIISQVQHVVDLAPRARLKELGLDARKLKRWLDVATSLIHCGRKYDPDGRIDEVVIFHAIPFRGTKEEWMEKLKPWEASIVPRNLLFNPLLSQGFTRNGARFVEVDGYHYTLMNPENVRSFSKKLKAEIERQV